MVESFLGHMCEVVSIRSCCQLLFELFLQFKASQSTNRSVTERCHPLAGRDTEFVALITAGTCCWESQVQYTVLSPFQSSGKDVKGQTLAQLFLFFARAIPLLEISDFCSLPSFVWTSLSHHLAQLCPCQGLNLPSVLPKLD